MPAIQSATTFMEASREVQRVTTITSAARGNHARQSWMVINGNGDGEPEHDDHTTTY